MAILDTDIDYFGSGGTSETDPANYLGGIISTTQIVNDSDNNIFLDVDGDEAGTGSTKYRAIFVGNSHGSLTLQNSVLWIESNTTSGDDTVNISLATEGVQASGNIQTIADEDTAPSAQSFTAPANKPAGLVIGDIPFGEDQGIWIERVVDAAASAINANAFTLRVEGDTLA